jgi:hypothetical protein
MFIEQGRRQKVTLDHVMKCRKESVLKAMTITSLHSHLDAEDLDHESTG